MANGGNAVIFFVLVLIFLVEGGALSARPFWFSSSTCCRFSRETCLLHGVSSFIDAPLRKVRRLRGRLQLGAA